MDKKGRRNSRELPFRSMVASNNSWAMRRHQPIEIENSVQIHRPLQSSCSFLEGLPMFARPRVCFAFASIFSILPTPYCFDEDAKTRILYTYTELVPYGQSKTDRRVILVCIPFSKHDIEFKTAVGFRRANTWHPLSFRRSNINKVKRLA